MVEFLESVGYDCDQTSHSQREILMVRNPLTPDEFPILWEPYRSLLNAKYGKVFIGDLAKKVFHEWIPLEALKTTPDEALQLPHLVKLEPDEAADRVGVSRATMYRLLEGKTPSAENLIRLIMQLALSPSRPPIHHMVFKILAQVMINIDNETRSRDDETEEEIEIDEIQCAMLHFCFWHKKIKNVNMVDPHSSVALLRMIFAKTLIEIRKLYPNRALSVADNESTFFSHRELYFLFGLTFEMRKQGVFHGRK